MNRTKTIYFLSAIVCIIGCYALSLSYSLFVDTQEKEIVNATVPGLSYSLETSTFDIEAGSGELIKLKVINSGTADLKYGIKAVADTLNGATIQLVEKEDNDIVGELSASTTEGETSSKEVWVFVTNSTETDITGLTFNLTAKYSTLNFDADTFKTSSNIDCVKTVKLLNNAILARAKSTEITDSDKTVYSTTLSTTPAEEPSGENERLLLETEDDYTATTGKNSYYFRGNVKDNFVNFADMCWRIVRIEGDGSVKLILEDQYTTCDDNETELTSVVNTGNWNIGTGNYGYIKENNIYRMNYLNPVTSNTSSMVKAFYDFQTTKLTDYTAKLKSGDWCLDDKAYTISGTSGSYTYTLLEDTSSNYLSGTSFYYDAYTRLTSGNANGYQPTLICNGTVLDKFATVSGVSSEAPMYVSAITADEIVHAGCKYGSSNNNYYLINDYQRLNGDWFWALSPYGFLSSGDYAFLVLDDGSVNHSYVGSDVALRPSVSLASSAVILDGDGTQEKPYVIG